MTVVVGFDGGGTGTAVQATDTQTHEKWTFDFGPTNRHSVGDVQVLKTLEHVFETLEDAGLSKTRIKSICFGGAGVDTEEDACALRRLFEKAGYSGALRVVNDSLTALVGANKGKRGAILISGTGSIALGIDEMGRQVRVGGWGHLIDDAGSAYAIARDGLCAVLSAYDGRARSTAIWRVLRQKLELERPQDLLDYVYAKDRQKQDIAALAPLITQLAGQDEAVDRIMEETATALFAHVKALTVKMRSEDFELSYIGSVLEKSSDIRGRLTDKISAAYPFIKVHFPELTPVEGALILAREGLLE